MNTPRKPQPLSRSLVALTFMLISLASATLAADEPYDYRLKDLDGVEYRASDSLGKWLIINFWATWCTPCLEEMPELERFYQNNQARVDLWGVTFEDSDIAAIRRYIEQLGITYPILGYGQDPKTGYGTVKVLPTTFVIDPEGRFHYKFEQPIKAQDLERVLSLDPVPDA